METPDTGARTRGMGIRHSPPSVSCEGGNPCISERLYMNFRVYERQVHSNQGQLRKWLLNRHR